MPTYEYECSSCGHRFEVFQSITHKPLRSCPGCGGETLHRLIGSGSGIIFKGPGFYQTDYKRASQSEKDISTECPSPKTDGGCGSCPLKQGEHG